MIRELSEPVQTVYFGSRWRVLAIAREKVRLAEMLEQLEASAGTDDSSSAPERLCP